MKLEELETVTSTNTSKVTEYFESNNSIHKSEHNKLHFV